MPLHRRSSNLGNNDSPKDFFSPGGWSPGGPRSPSMSGPPPGVSRRFTVGAIAMDSGSASIGGGRLLRAGSSTSEDSQLPITPQSPLLKTEHEATNFQKLTYQDQFHGVIYGLVNFTICIPALVSYCHICFSDPRFTTQMPSLVKLMFLSSAVHQFVFCVRSTLPYAVGQVQDVGLIFLSAMVRSLIGWAVADGVPWDEIVTTAVWQCSIATTIVGICVISIGRARLSEYVQMIPYPVVAGYLGYIGYFCLAAGFSIASMKSVTTPSTWYVLWDFAIAGKLGLMATMTVALYIVENVECISKHCLAMPAMMFSLPAAFFLGLYILDISPEDARENGWLPPIVPVSPGFAAFELFDPSKVHWAYLPRQIVNLVGLIIVVAFGSALDVAAIQASVEDQQLDFNAELVTVGVGNLCSGLSGGFTGSYIFSQTAFSLRRRVVSRWNGLVVCVLEFLLFLVPVDTLRVQPNAFIAAIMCLFGIDIMKEWLFDTFGHMSPVEYSLVWISFTAVMCLTEFSSFGVIEGIFFGCVAAAFIFAGLYAQAPLWWPVSSKSSVVRTGRERRAGMEDSSRIFAVSLSGFPFFGNALRLARSLFEEAERRDAIYVVLDLSGVVGLDSTAASELRNLKSKLTKDSRTVVTSGCQKQIVKIMLERHGFLEDGVDNPTNFQLLDDALQHCEHELLKRRGMQPRIASTQEWQLQDILMTYLEDLSKQLAMSVTSDDVDKIVRCFSRINYSPDRPIFHEMEPANKVIFIAKGTALIGQATSSDGNAKQPPSINREKTPGRPSKRSECLSFLGPHSVLGDVNFLSGTCFSFDAVAGPKGCVLYEISKQTFDKLSVQEPRAALLLVRVLMHDVSQLCMQTSTLYTASSED